MSERGTRGDEAAAAFRAGLPYIHRKLVTSDKWVAGVNAGGILFSEITEVSMPASESFANSRSGQLVAAVTKLLTPSTDKHV